MTESHCRIAKIRYKDKPHLVEIIPAPRNDFHQTMHEHVDLIAEAMADKMAGFAIVAWDFDGRFTRGTRLHEKSFVGNTLLPSFVAEILRRDVAQFIAEDVYTGNI